MQNREKRYINREIFSEVSAHLDQGEMTLITGSRQVGKTVLLEQLKQYLVNKKKVKSEYIFHYNLDIIQDEEVFHNQTQFIEFLEDRSAKQKIYVFVDEAQKVPEAARFFKGVYDSKLNVKLVLTGSSSLEIKAKFKEVLTGRKIIFQLDSFSFVEFLRAKDKILANMLVGERKITSIDQKQLVKLYKEYITYGGYPRVVLAQQKKEKDNILREIYSSYIERDAVSFLAIKNKTAFNRLVKLLSAQIGQLVNIDELATNLAVDRNTVERYLHVLEETFIIKKINPYFKNQRQEIIKAGKIYFRDCGIRNLALENFNFFDDRTDKGSLLENAVSGELLFLNSQRAGKLYFWRTKQKAEVDFVIEKGLKLLPIEVKTRHKKSSVPKGLRSFLKKFSVQEAIIVSLSAGEDFSINLSAYPSGQPARRPAGKTKISVIYPFDLRSIISKLK
ncbi:MAG: AAA family ATPase [Parcubacteria group bacterium]